MPCPRPPHAAFSVPKKKATNLTIDTATLRQLAVVAGCDPRTIKAILDGGHVRGLARERARQALLDAGYVIPSPEGASK